MRLSLKRIQLLCREGTAGDSSAASHHQPPICRLLLRYSSVPISSAIISPLPIFSPHFIQSVRSLIPSFICSSFSSSFCPFFPFIFFICHPNNRRVKLDRNEMDGGERSSPTDRQKPIIGHLSPRERGGNLGSLIIRRLPRPKTFLCSPIWVLIALPQIRIKYSSQFTPPIKIEVNNWK